VSSPLPSATTAFRPDIQGLRAIAVLVVVVFHAGLPLPGGFAGVDVFFAISGFVITTKLLRDHQKDGRISLRDFYRRRFLRLTPALALMISVTLILGSVILFPADQRIAELTGVGALFLVANIVIARSTGGYFDGPAESNPLLNTWSLSVEEQFYLVFPALILLALTAATWRRRRALTVSLISLVSIASLAAAIYGARQAPGDPQLSWLNFYSPVGRVWEFGIGALIALLPLRASQHTSRKWAATALGVLGLVLIFGTVVLASGNTPWPGPATLAPVVGTGLVIIAGSMHPPGPVSQVLGVRPMTAMGDWSYSIYLWHWPFISLAVYMGIEGALPLSLVALLSFVPALLSYRYVEQPMRALRPSRPWAFPSVVAATVGIPLALAVSLSAVVHPGVRYAGDLGPAYLTFIDQNSVACEGALGAAGTARCRQSVPGSTPRVVVVGDSHAEHLYPGFLAEVPDVNIGYANLPDWPIWPNDASKRLFDAIEADPDIETVVLGSRWTPELYGELNLAGEVERLVGSGKEVLIATDGPYFSFHAQQCKYERLLFDARCEESSAAFEVDYADYMGQLRNHLRDFPAVHYLDTAGAWCTDGLCSMVQNGQLMYADQGHLNKEGAAFIVKHLLDTDVAFSAAVSARG
jgi:peptidoglycan/LPS O-acetylase OafA/YrhL